jgi:ribosome recycling factor
LWCSSTASLDALADLSKDELERAEKELDKIIHAQEAEISDALGAKETELMED